ncbi:insulin-like growth factor-binding complex acid labile [Brachionus plicatilis]|uniref:Insulin-like growth factor-binding complex acid labile n=1 Tax=Brachionus plicatilis TaxID=10195 RepID=A0A3M7P6N3_BRAPC|nr:insulin-like growth factor-binding complex acid labile [Brachionus plicatilis]
MQKLFSRTIELYYYLLYHTLAFKEILYYTIKLKYIFIATTYNVECVAYNVECVAYNENCVAYNVECVAYNVECVAYNVECVAYNENCVAYNEIMESISKFLVFLTLMGMTKCQFFAGHQSFSQICQSGIREDNTNYIYCARRGLSEVPMFSKNNVIYDELVLSDNKIKSLNSNSFSRIKVKKVFLNGNPIETIEPQTFSKLENNLEELWLDSILNTYQEYEIEPSMIGLPNPIANLRNLNTLKLKGFHVKSLSSSILRRLNRLELLSLKFCSIEKIDPDAFDGLKNNLKELYLDGNLLQSVPTESLSLLSFKQLRVLSLSQNVIKILDITSFGHGISSVLIRLDMSYNGLRQIDSKAFSSFNKTLKELLLQNNELNSYNLKFVQNLPALNELNLDFNLINKLDNFMFAKSAALESLSLQGNSIQFDGDTQFVFHGLSRLQRLNLARNSIKHLPDGLFKNLNSLTNLVMDKNNLNEFDKLNELTFDGILSTLVNISLQYNKLKSSQLICLNKFEHLERVKLGYNRIEQLDMNMFKNVFATLTNLDAQNNQIAKVVLDDEHVLNSLNELDLSNNNLCTFNNNLLKSNNLKSVSLSQNPLYCDCRLRSLYQWTRENLDKDMFNYIQWQCELESGEKRKFSAMQAEQFTCLNSSRSRCASGAEPTVSKPVQMARIRSINLKVMTNTVLVDWTLDQKTSDDIRGFKLTYSKPNSSQELSNFLVEKSKRSFKLDNLSFGTKYTICISIIRQQGYDKYCRDAQILDDEFAIKKSEPSQQTIPAKGQPLSEESQTYDYLNTSSNLMITILIILVVFILILIIFLYFYVLKCRLSEKKLKKNLYSGTLCANSLGSQATRRGIYQGGVLSSTVEKKPLDLVHKSDNKCCCLIGQNTIANQRFIIHQGHYALGDSSTVSSTLSSLKNANGALTMSPNKMGEWRFKPAVNNADLASSSPASFSHFGTAPNGVPNEQAYVSYELYNCYQNPNNAALIIPANSQKLGTASNQSDHVYCEIPSTIGRPYRTLNHNGNICNSHGYHQIQNSHCIPNAQNTSTSLLLSSSTASSTANSNSSSPQSSNNTKFTNASII